jgi:ABC-type branched-subunit amino acid transport system ATPase component
MTSDRIVLNVRGVTKRFGGLVAVDSMDFDVREHEVMGLIGPNGSGKTTMMNLISGALKLTSGRISLEGRQISDLPAKDINRRGVARTFQLVKMLPTLSVIENVLAGAVFGHKRRWGHDAENFAHKILQQVGMDYIADAPVSSLTYIDQKRLELARALASEPEILLLDEWLAGLNPTELETGIALIKELRAEGRTIILVEHVMDAIRSLCDNCVVMNTGRKIAEGSPDKVLTDPEVVRAYLGDDDA